MENPPPCHADVQTTVLRSLDPQVVIYLFFKITDTAVFRQQLPLKADPSSLNGEGPRFETEASRIEKEGPHRRDALKSKPAAKAQQSQPDSQALLGSFSNIAFTFAGLTKLGVDPDTLATFPQDFREGMAVRAEILGDKGDAAPEKWDGYLGSLQIDGVMWLNFRLSSRCADDSLAEYEKRLAQAKAVFPSAWFPPCPAPKMRRGERNNGSSKPAQDDGAPKTIAGAEVLHVEFGMANYVQDGQGKSYRVEHFGNRDGVSQPYANLDLDPPPPGGGTPRDNGSWAPVATGEILLGHSDEDGRVQHLPANSVLRNNGTYMALRKLEQDVAGFRNFLNRHQDELGVSLGPQMIGRWPDGSSLVQFPEGPEQLGQQPRGINDFRYQRDDPFGRRCPIGAHIRRANPRDTNNRDQARRHRLFRRGISYGGPLLPANSVDEECPRGLLFVSMQARLDRQFEFVLTSWLGRAELEGQAGAKLDPILGDHCGRLEDAFQTTDRFGPVTGLPRFVTMRGGEYFFMPSVSALAGLHNADAFPVDDNNAPLPQDAVGTIEAAQTDNSQQLIACGKALLVEGALACKPLPQMFMKQFPNGPDVPVNSVLVGRYDYVKRVLQDGATYSTRTLGQRALEITSGQPLLISMASDNPERVGRLKFLQEALALLKPPNVFEIADRFVKEALQRVAPLGRLDVVNDFGRVVPILCAGALFGVHGPDYVSATGVAALFGRVDMTDIPDDWLRTLPPVEDYAKPIVAMQWWTRLSFLQIFVNVVNAGEVVEAAERATREFLRQIGSLIFEAQSQALPTPPENLLQALVTVQRSKQDPDLSLEIQLILTEFAAGSVETVNAAIANVFDYLLDNKEQVRLALCQVMSASTDSSFEELMHILQKPSAEHTNILDRLIFEILRFKPMGPLSFRFCEADGAKIGDCSVPKGTNVILVPAAAMVDERAFPHPEEIRFDRPFDSYLHFGAGGHTCAGQRIDAPIAYRIALPMLRALFVNLASLPGLRRAAGPEGVLRQTSPTLADSLVMRFEPR